MRNFAGASDELDRQDAVEQSLDARLEQERLQELHDVPFGTYGQFYDRFGVQWIFKGTSKKGDLE